MPSTWMMKKRNPRHILLVVGFTILMGLSGCYFVYLPSDPFLNAARSGNTEKVQAFLDQGSDINFTEEEGITALMLAAAYEWFSVVELLLERGADVNAKDRHNITALMYATGRGKASLAICRVLLDKGADVNARADNGATALMFAAVVDSVDEVRLLLERGADVNAKTTDGNTALSGAKRFGHSQVAALLETAGAKE